MLARFREMHAGMSDSDFFNQPGIGFLREAWAAAKFGDVRCAESVRLVPADAQWPDFEIQLGGICSSWEFTEAQVPGRSRGQEYAERAKRRAAGGSDSRADPVEDWIKRADSAPEAMRAAAGGKAAKGYSAKAGLLILLTLSEYGIRQTQIESCFPVETEVAKDAFSEVWVLWKDCAYLTWENGKAATQKLVPAHRESPLFDV